MSEPNNESQQPHSEPTPAKIGRRKLLKLGAASTLSILTTGSQPNSQTPKEPRKVETETNKKGKFISAPELLGGDYTS